MNSGIYKWKSPSGKCYIGQSVNLKNRYNDFITNEFYSSGNSLIDKARKKYNNYSEWEYEIIEYCRNELLNDREKYWIQYYNTYNRGYNSTIGGDGCSGINIKGENNPMYGKHHSEQTKEQISIKKLNNPNVGKNIELYENDTYIKTFNSVRQLSSFLNTSHSNILKHIKRKTPFVSNENKYTFNFK